MMSYQTEDWELLHLGLLRNDTNNYSPYPPKHWVLVYIHIQD